MKFADQFGILFLLVLLSMTGTSFFIQKYNLYDKLKHIKLGRRVLWVLCLLHFVIGLALSLFVKIIFGILLIYIGLMMFISLKSDDYKWILGIMKVGYLFVLVYFILYTIDRMGLWDKLKFIWRAL